MKYALLGVSVSYSQPCVVRDQTRTPKNPQAPRTDGSRAQSTYSELTDPSSRMRRIVSASSSATDSCRMRPALLAAGLNGIVSVTTSSSSAELVILSTAPPDNTGWVMYAITFSAPSSFRACAAWQSVPAVSTMSSTSRQVLPSTSPMMFMTFDSLGCGRRLSMITLRYACFQASPSSTGEAYTLSTGMSKNP